MGPAEALLALVRGRYRFRLLLQGPRSFDIQGFIRVMLACVAKMPSSVRVQIDIDPQSFKKAVYEGRPPSSLKDVFSGERILSKKINFLLILWGIAVIMSCLYA